jgi:hypothetical protein
MDIVGKRFGRLTVIREAAPKRYRKGNLRMYVVRCDCGKEKEVYGSNLRRGGTKSCGCHQGRLVNIVGLKFGLLTVLKRAGSKQLSSGYPLVTWLAECECGAKKVVDGKSLKNGATRSCGCLWKLPSGVAARNKFLGGYKAGAEKRGLQWELTDAEFDVLTQASCHYCGAPPSEHLYNPNFNGAYKGNGIDRKDNTKGYTIGNCLPACRDCNWMKGKKSYDEFVGYLKRAGRFQLGINATKAFV